MNPFKMAQPKTIKGAVSVLNDEQHTTPLLAGGTDLIGEIKEGVRQPDMLVNLKSVEGLKQIREDKGSIRIGALVTLSQLQESPLVQKRLPALAETLAKTASAQIRSTATVGGNICQRPRCWYYRDQTFDCLKKGGELCYAREGENEYHAIFDNATCNIVHPSNLAPVFMAYDSSFEIVGPDESETVPANEFFVSPEEDISVENILMPRQILTAVVIPASGMEGTARYEEARERQSFDWALAGATVRLEMEKGKVREARVILSAVAPTPVRREDIEKQLVGKALNKNQINKVCETAISDATPLHQNAYKTSLVKAVLRRALNKAKTS